MAELTKVTIPKEVAEAVERLRRRGYSDYHILSWADGGIYPKESETIRKWAFDEEGEGSPELLMEALVNGYKIEDTPEDKLRDLYEDFETQNDFALGVRRGILHAVTILGITIEGINDKEADPCR